MRFGLYLLVVVMTCKVFSICPACMKRRAKMMANRPNLEAATVEAVNKVKDFDPVRENFEDGFYQDFFNQMRKNFLKASKKKEYQTAFYHRKAAYARIFGQSILDMLNDYPQQLLAIKRARTAQIADLQKNFPKSHLNPLLEFLSVDHCSESVMASLNAIGSDPRFSKIEKEFWLYVHLYNTQAMQRRDARQENGWQNCLALDYERLRRMEEQCVEDSQTVKHIETLRAALPNLAKFFYWERFLRKIASDCYKLPEEIDQKLADIQKGYMSEKSKCIRAHRELTVYR